MSIDDFPKTALEFDERFSSEEACRTYLMKVRWPEGFRCATCGGTKAWTSGRLYLICSHCGYQASLTAGTVMHGSHKPLRMWFKAMWWVCTQKTGGSAKGLQKQLDLGSYQTAWAWLQKLRRAMIRAGREALEGPVEVDDAFLGGKEIGVRGRETIKKAKIVVAVEVTGDTRNISGRVRFGHIPDFSANSLVPFVVENVAPGSQVITDGWEGYGPLADHGFIHQTRIIGSDKKRAVELLPNAHREIALLKRWLMGTHQGAVRPKQLQHYLNEFAFRHNRRKVRHVGKIFYRMLQGSVMTKATPYWRLIGRETPDRPLYIGST